MMQFICDRWRGLMRWLTWRRVRGATRCRLYVTGIGEILLALLLTTQAILTGVELGEFAHNQEFKAQLAQEFESFPDQWAQSIEDREYQHSLFPDEGITPYRAELERELLKAYRPKAEAIAQRIREMNDKEFYTQLTSKGLQTLLATGGGAIVGKVGGEAANAAKYVIDGAFSAETVRNLQGQNDLHATLENRRNLLLQEMEWLMDRRLQDWSTAEPLLQARLATHIRFLKNQQGNLSDEEYTRLVRERAISIDTSMRLTRASGSEDSPWADFEELAQWLAEQVGRPLKEKSAETVRVTFVEDSDKFDFHVPPYSNCFTYKLRYQGGPLDVRFDEEEYWIEDDRGSRRSSPWHTLCPYVGIEAGEDRIEGHHIYIHKDAGLYTQHTVWRGKDENGQPVEVEFTIQILAIVPE